MKVDYIELGYNKQNIIVSSLVLLVLGYSWLLQTPLKTNKFGQSQEVRYNRVLLFLQKPFCLIRSAPAMRGFDCLTKAEMKLFFSSSVFLSLQLFAIIGC